MYKFKTKVRAKAIKRLSLVLVVTKSTAIPTPGEGQVLLKTLYLSLDPYMRGRMNAGKSYADRVELGATMVGGTVSRVEQSRNPNSALKQRTQLQIQEPLGSAALGRRLWSNTRPRPTLPWQHSQPTLPEDVHFGTRRKPLTTRRDFPW